MARTWTFSVLPVAKKQKKRKPKREEVQVLGEALQPLKDFQTGGQDLDFSVLPVAKKQKKA